jgi:hypothetical protein
MTDTGRRTIKRKPVPLFACYDFSPNAVFDFVMRLHGKHAIQYRSFVCRLKTARSESTSG